MKQIDNLDKAGQWQLWVLYGTDDHWQHMRGQCPYAHSLFSPCFKYLDFWKNNYYNIYGHEFVNYKFIIGRLPLDFNN